MIMDSGLAAEPVIGPRDFARVRWLCAIYLSDITAAALGLVWIAGRIMYFIGYSKAVEKRLPGFSVQSTACFLLFIGAAVGVALHLARG
jgi:glutathione S-transferase